MVTTLILFKLAVIVFALIAAFVCFLVVRAEKRNKHLLAVERRRNEHYWGRCDERLCPRSGRHTRRAE